MCTCLAGGEVVVLSHSKRCVHEYLWHGRQVFDAQHLQAQEVPVYGLPVDGLAKDGYA